MEKPKNGRIDAAQGGKLGTGATRRKVRKQRQISFDIETFVQDFLQACRQRQLSPSKAGQRVGVNSGTMSLLISGKSYYPSVHTLARMMTIMSKPDINKYVIEEQ